MAHFAKIVDGIVTRVEKIDNSVILDNENNEQESLGQQFLRDLYNEPEATWLKTSYNTRENQYYVEDETTGEYRPEPTLSSKAFRGNYAGPDMIWDSENQIFYPPSPYPSWVFSLEKAGYNPPYDPPEDGHYYEWDEDSYNADNTQGWVRVGTETPDTAAKDSASPDWET